MNSVEIRVNDFTVEYRKAKVGNNVEIYIDGDLVEERQYTWYLSKLLEETLYYKEVAKEYRGKFSRLKSFCRKNFDENLVDEFIDRVK